MERDLNLKKLFKMYVLNSWVIILAGILVALGISAFIEGVNEVTFSKSVFLVYDLEGEESKMVEMKKNTYFDAYKGVLSGNVLNKSDVFSDEEKQKLQGISVAVESSCYTISMTVEDSGDRESDEKILEKYLDESEKWMQEQYKDSSIKVEVLKESMESNEGGNGVMKIALGFIVGAVLAVLGLFIWFVVDKKIRTEEDVKYYTGLECVTIVKRR